MHIVFFVDYPDASLGGTQTSVRAQRKALERAGHLVTMVTPPPKGEIPNDLNTVFVPGLPYSPYEYPLVLPSRRRERWIIRELAKRPPIDVIHIQTNVGMGIMGIHIAKQLAVPLVQTMHTRDDVFMQKTVAFPGIVTTPAWLVHKVQLGAPHTPVRRLDEPWSAHNSWRVMVHHAQQADVVTVPSRHFAERLQERGLTRPIEVVSNGLDDDMINEVRQGISEKRVLQKPLQLTWVNRLSAEKRPLLCLEAIKDIEGVVIDLYGDGPDKAALQRYIAERHLEDKVRLRGRVSQAEALHAIAASDVFVLSSYQFDTQSMVLLESLAMGVPVLLSDPDLVESLPEGAYVLTPTPDAAGLRSSIADLVAHPEKIAAMQKVAWEHRDNPLQSKVAEKMIAVYEQAIHLAAARGAV